MDSQCTPQIRVAVTYNKPTIKLTTTADSMLQS